MSDNGEEEDEPVVELGDGPDVEGAPVSRVASRLFFPIEESEVLRREGETTVRTPDGPRTVADVLQGSDEVYFETNADLVGAVRSVVGTGPVPTDGGGPTSGEPAAAGDDEAAVDEPEDGTEADSDGDADGDADGVADSEGDADVAQGPDGDADGEAAPEGDADADELDPDIEE